MWQQAAVMAGQMAIEAGQQKLQQYQQKSLTRQQIAANKEMSQFNQNMAIDTWKKTGPAAQRQQLEEAGLNIGLMYQGSGPGGTTSQPGNVTRGQAPTPGMGIQMAAQIAQTQLIQAQKQNIEADTKNKEAQNPSLQKQADQIQANIDFIKGQTANNELQNVILTYEADMKKIQADIAGQTKDYAMNTVIQNYDKTKAEAETVARKNRIEESTLEKTIQAIQNNLILQAAEIAFKDAQTAATKTGTYLKPAETIANIQKIDEEIKKLQADRQVAWETLSLKDWEVWLKARATEFQFGDEASKLRWINTMMDGIKAFKK